MAKVKSDSVRLRGNSKVAIVYQASPLDEFICDKQVDKFGEVRFVSTDLRMFFQQQKLISLGLTDLDALFPVLRQSDALSKFSDEQLMSAIKSRYIQSVGDIYSYTRYLQSNLESASQELADTIQAQLDSVSDGNIDPPKPE